MKNLIVYHVEDSELFRKSFRDSFQNDAVDIRSFRNSDEAEKALIEIAPDAVVSDSVGAIFVKKLAADNNCRHIPVVFLSGEFADSDPELSQYPSILKSEADWGRRIRDAIHVTRFFQQIQQRMDITSVFKNLQTLPEAFHQFSEFVAVTPLPTADVVLERLEGVVDCIEDGQAFVTLRSEHGDELIGEYPAAEFERLGVRERRRFLCETVESANHEIQVRLTKIPDIKWTEADELAIDREIEELVAD